MTRTPLVAANWKMNGRYGLVAELGAALAAADLGRAEVGVISRRMGGRMGPTLV